MIDFLAALVSLPAGLLLVALGWLVTRHLIRRC
jgi:hypothetical protein